METKGFPTTAKAKVLLGAPYSGKTTALIDEIRAWLDKGGHPSDALVLCASASAAREFDARLRSSCPEACGVRVTTPCERFLEILDTPHARNATGRVPRLLLPYEYSFFLEDLKTSAIRPGRLREMLKFLYKGFCDLADDDPDWLITNEERELVGLMRSSLQFMGAVLKEEVPGLAVKYLREAFPQAGCVRSKAVFIDDFSLLSRASQHAACMLTSDFVCITGDSVAAALGEEAYPNVEGVQEFIDSQPAVEIRRLDGAHSCGSAAQWSCRMRRVAAGQDDFDWDEAAAWSKEAAHAPDTLHGVLCGSDPDDEFKRVADKVEELLGQGCRKRDIVIAVENPVWRRCIAGRLCARGVDAEVLSSAGFLKCDVRFLERSAAARLVALLNLLADPHDGVAWRCWCGFGDYLANSNGMRRLRESCGDKTARLADVLQADDLQADVLDSLDAIVSVQRIAKARDDARSLMEPLRGLEGMDLLNAAAEGIGEKTVSEAVRSVASIAYESGERNDAASMVQRLRRRALFPSFDGDNAVKVVSYASMAGLAPRHLVLAGFMNGIFPAHDRFDATELSVERMRRRRVRDVSVAANVVAKAADSVTVSVCCKAELEAAQRVGLVVSRIALEGGRRVALLEPSVFLKLAEGESCQA